MAKPRSSPLCPALDHVVVTSSEVARWRQDANYPAGRIGVVFGVATAIHFCPEVDPAGFDFYPLPSFPNGVLLFERGVAAYRAFRELHPTWEIIF